MYPEALYPDDFDPTTYEVALGNNYLNAIIDVYPRVNTVTHTITLPPASADLAGSKIGFSGPSNALILVKSLVNVDPNRTILVSLQGRGEFVVLNNGNGDYNWHTRSLDQPGLGGGSPGGTARDPFAVGDNLVLTAAVMGATWVDGDLTSYASAADQQAAAPPAKAGQDSSILVGSADVATNDEFDDKDSTGSAWRYRYGRRNDGTSGWTRTPKG